MGGSVSSLLDPDNPDDTVVPAGYITPPFPSLYAPSFVNTKSDVGVFLYQAEVIWRYTLYWTLVLLGGTFTICALFAVLTTLLSITANRKDRRKSDPPDPEPDTDPTSYKNILQYNPPAQRLRTRPKRGRAPLWPLIIIPFVMAATAALVALVTGTVVGFALAAIYSAGGFTMSTWVPFLWALIEVVVLIVSSYSTLTSIL